ncbi:hypothetical protein O1611_g797 [Lasiodiplodia mahajangana]|uniref:Uncharacterized protein n=1 Tax=Lasiodiplodia mahajangana TaxID=1108764 RepID=A0ACC2JZI0_9PEZI|nr:hypothetical protein O1611_g797 [Lasiodiplodia mahajangana]
MLLESGIVCIFTGGAGQDVSRILHSMRADRFFDCTQFMLRNALRIEKSMWLMAHVRTAMKTTEGNNLHTLRYLVENDIGLESLYELSPEVGVDSCWQRQYKTTLLHNAVSPHIPFDLFELLLEKRKCDINTEDILGRTAASSILCHLPWDKDKAALLFKHGADPLACSCEEDRMVMQAIKDEASRSDVQNLLDGFDARRVTRFKVKGEGNSKTEQLALFRSLGATEVQANELFRDESSFTVARGLFYAGWSIETILSLDEEGRQILFKAFGREQNIPTIRDAYIKRPQSIRY